MGGKSIELVPVGEVREEVVRLLAEELSKRLGLAVSHQRPFAPRAEWDDTGSDGWPSDAVLDSLIEWAAPRARSGDWPIVLGIAQRPLLVPDRENPFGHATIGGCCAVVSLAPLGDPADPLRNQRLLKEAVHELGHVCGLGHCRDPACVMYPSPDLATTDRKGQAFCRSCGPQAAARYPAIGAGGSP